MNRRSFLNSTSASAALAFTESGCTNGDNKADNKNSRQKIESLAGMPLPELRKRYYADLFNEYLPFLEKHVIDNEHGGFMCNTRPDGTQVTTGKRAGYEGRGIWVFSFLYNNLAKKQKYLDVAAGSAKLLLKNKPVSDDMWPGSFTRTGESDSPPGRSVNADMYIAEGFAEFALASGDSSYFALAKEIVNKCQRVYDSPGYALNAIKRFPDSETGGISGIRIMDDWMLFLRAATRMLEQKPDSELETLASRCVDTIINNYYNNDFGLVVEMLNYDHSRFDNEIGQFINFGNDFQALWHVMDEAVRIKNKVLFDTVAKRLRHHIEVAWDDVYGGVFNVLEHVDENRWSLGKTHYAQVETLVGLLKIIEHTGADWAGELFTKIYRYVDEKFPQKQYGYPLWILGSDRMVTFRENATRIGNFHQPRHLMLNLTALDRIIKRRGRISGVFV
ncbi:MAG: AGE family epimerase/isomerase [Candidatus Latescibacteria bacterium]|nr:AGE family epimerase/isomerase [Candidatus Latescibacterota bacterium]